MKRIILPVLIALASFCAFNAGAQEGTKQFMPNKKAELYLEFNAFDKYNFTNRVPDQRRIYVRLNKDEKMHFGMKLLKKFYGYGWGGDGPEENNVCFRIYNPDGSVAYPINNSDGDINATGGLAKYTPASGQKGYIASYEQAVAGPNEVKLNGKEIEGGYTPITIEAKQTGNYWFEFETGKYYSWYGWIATDMRFAFEFFDVTVTDENDNIITNPGEPNKSAGRLWSKGWGLSTYDFNSRPIEAYFHVFTEDAFINKINFKAYPYSFILQANSYGIKPNDPNYVVRAQSQEGQSFTLDAAEYPIFLNDPDRNVWPNAKIAPPDVDVFANNRKFFDYDYLRPVPYLDSLTNDTVYLDLNRQDNCGKPSVAVFKIKSNIDGFCALLIDVSGDGIYKPGGDDRLLYYKLRRGDNYVLWNFRKDNESPTSPEVGVGNYSASATFLGRGPTNFPMQDVEQLDAVNTAAVRPFSRLKASIYWDDMHINQWGDGGNGQMGETVKRQLTINKNVQRYWNYWDNEYNDKDYSGDLHNGNENTLNTWFNAIDLGYSRINIKVVRGTECREGTKPWVGSLYKDTLPKCSIPFTQTDFEEKFFDPYMGTLSQVLVMTLPKHGKLKLGSNLIENPESVPLTQLNHLVYVPDETFIGRDSFKYMAKSTAGTNNFSENQDWVYLTINTPPELTINVSDQNLCTNQTKTVEVTVTDPDNNADLNKVHIRAYSSDPSFVPHDNITVTSGGTGNDGVKFNVEVKPIANRSGMAIIYLLMYDEYSSQIEQFTVYVGPDLQFEGDTTPCKEEQLHLRALQAPKEGVTYKWEYKNKTGDGWTTKSSTRDLTVEYSAGYTGTWKLTVCDGDCTSSREFTVSHEPVTTFDGDLKVCAGELFELTAHETNATYLWSKGGVTMGKNQKYSQTANESMTGKWKLTVKKNNCEDAIEFDVSVVQAPRDGMGTLECSAELSPGEDGWVKPTAPQHNASGGEYSMYYRAYIDDVLVGSSEAVDADDKAKITIPADKLKIGANVVVVRADNEHCEEDFTNNTCTINVLRPGIEFADTANLVTDENGLQATFKFRLRSKPQKTVTIAFTSSDEGEGKVTTGTVTVEPTAWTKGTWTTVTVKGQSDNEVDGDQHYTVTLNVSSEDTYYNSAQLQLPKVNLVNKDVDKAEVLVSPVTITTSESGSSATYTVKLTSKPSHDVKVSISQMPPASEGTVSPTSVVLNASNWSTGATFKVTGVPDNIDDGDYTYTITHLAGSEDPNYNNKPVPSVTVTNLDIDEAKFTIGQPTGTQTYEDVSKPAVTFTVCLSSMPKAGISSISVPVVSSKTTEGTVNPATLTFNLTNWNVPQTVTVKGADDFICDGNQPYTVTVGPAQNFEAPAHTLKFTNIDNDKVGLTITYTGDKLTTYEDQTKPAATFNIKLKSQPVGSVVYKITSNKPGEGTVENAGTGTGKEVRFDAQNWNLNQAVNVKGVDDQEIDGDQPYKVQVTLTQGDNNTHPDGKYTPATNQEIPALNIDNDTAAIFVAPLEVSTNESDDGHKSGCFTVRLSTKPTAPVHIRCQVLPDQLGQESDEVKLVDDNGNLVYEKTITITESNWNSGVEVCLSGLSDNTSDDDQEETVKLHPAQSADTHYNGLDPDDVKVRNIDIDKAQFILTPTTLETVEGAEEKTINAWLTSKPIQTVKIKIELSGDYQNEVTLTPASEFVFEPGSWTKEQRVTIRVKPLHDKIADGDKQYTIRFYTETDDDKYQNKEVSVSVTNKDIDKKGIVITPSENILTYEDQTQSPTELTVKLKSLPAAGDVKLKFTPAPATEGTPVEVTVPRNQWETGVKVQLRGADDNIIDGNQTCTYTVTVVDSDPSGYKDETASITVTNIDDDVAGVVLGNDTANLKTYEDQSMASATFRVKLSAKPTSNVTIKFSSSNSQEGTVTPTTLTFTSSNWNTTQTVTVKGVDDYKDDGDQYYQVKMEVTESADNHFVVGLPLPSVRVLNIDNDEAGFTVTPATGITDEKGKTFTFSVKPTSQPLANLTVTLLSTNTNEGIITVPAASNGQQTLLFTPQNWNAQEVTVKGVADNIDDGDQTYQVKGTVAQGSTSEYNGKTFAVNITNQDVDTAGLVLTIGGMPITQIDTTYEDDSKAPIVIQVRLKSKPTNQVNVILSSTNEVEGKVTVPTNKQLTFTTSNWDKIQNVTVKGQHDFVHDGNQLYNVTFDPNSNDSKYNSLTNSTVKLVNIDMDKPGYDWTFDKNDSYTSEDGKQVVVKFKLKSKPTSKLTVYLKSNDETEGIITSCAGLILQPGAQASLVFEPTSWNTPQDIVVTGQDDDVADGSVSYGILISIPKDKNQDTSYINLRYNPIGLTNSDNEMAGYIIDATQYTVDENDGQWHEVKYSLRSEPMSDLTYKLKLTQKGVVDFQPADSVLVFKRNKADEKGWNKPHIVKFKAIDNSWVNSDVNLMIQQVNVVASNPNSEYDSATRSHDFYLGNKLYDVNITIVNDDSAAMLISAISGNTAEKGDSAFFTISLSSKPQDNVCISLKVTNETEGKIVQVDNRRTAPLDTLTFTPDNWNTAQKVWVKGQDESEADGSKVYYVIVGDSIRTTDSYYSQLPKDSVKITNIDDDKAGLVPFVVDSITNEAGDTAMFTLALTSTPSGTNDVTLTITLEDTGTSEGTITKPEPSSGEYKMTFNSSNYSTPQTVVIKGLDDKDKDGDKKYACKIKSSSSDVIYGSLELEVNITNLDDVVPRLMNDKIETDEDKRDSVNIMRNDLGLDQGIANISVIVPPKHGTFVVDSSKTGGVDSTYVIYTPNGYYNGLDSLTYQVTLENNAKGQAKVYIDVAFSNDQPFAVDDSAGCMVGQSVTVNVLFNDYGLEDGNITVELDNKHLPNAAKGTAKVEKIENPVSGLGEPDSLLAVIFTAADEEKFGKLPDTVKFMYRIFDSQPGSPAVANDTSTAWVKITIRRDDLKPDAVDYHLNVTKNDTAYLNVLELSKLGNGQNTIVVENVSGKKPLLRMASHGTVSLEPSGLVRYLPKKDYFGPDTFEYMLIDVDGDFDIAKVFVDVHPVGPQPIGYKDIFAMEKGADKTLKLDIIANDLYLDTAKAYIETNLDIGATNGTLEYKPGSDPYPRRWIEYKTPNADFTTETSGPVSFGYIASDEVNRGLTPPRFTKDSEGNDRTSVRVFVNDRKHTVVAVNDTLYTEVDVPVLHNIIENDTLDDLLEIHIYSHAQPKLGKVEILDGGRLRYTPSRLLKGIDKFQYIVYDRHGYSDTAWVVVNILHEEVGSVYPIALDDERGYKLNQMRSIDVLFNDTLSNGKKCYIEEIAKTLTIDTVKNSLPANGTIVVKSAAHVIEYTPATDFSGRDSFLYQIIDQFGHRDTAMVMMTHGIAFPNAVDDDTVTFVGDTLWQINVLANDDGLDDGLRTMTIHQQPADMSGKAQVNQNYTIKFAPTRFYKGTTSFVYLIEDNNGDYDTARVVVRVLEKPESKPKLRVHRVGCSKNSTVDSIALLYGCTGLDDTPLTVTVKKGDNTQGTPELNGDGVTAKYTAKTDFVGLDTFYYKVVDNNGDFDTSMVIVTVKPGENFVPIAFDDVDTTFQGQSVVIAVLLNDKNLNDCLFDTSTVHILYPPFADRPVGNVVVNANATVTYTPPYFDFIGDDIFYYEVSDREGDYDTAKVVVRVIPKPNFYPDARDDASSCKLGETVNIDILNNDFCTYSGSGGRKYNLSDGDAPHTVTILDDPQPKFGTAVWDESNKRVIYTSDGIHLGADKFKYRLTDKDGQFDDAVVIVTIDTVYHKPIAFDDSVTVSMSRPDHKTSVVIYVLDNDQSPDGLHPDEAIELDELTLPKAWEGKATVDNKIRVITFEPADWYQGVVKFNYRVKDPQGDFDQAEVKVFVVRDQDGHPALDTIRLGCTKNGSRGIPLFHNALGMVDPPFKVKAENGKHGTVNPIDEITLDHFRPDTATIVTYTPETDFVGFDTFKFSVSDIDGQGDTSIVIINVKDIVNIVPLAVNDTVYTSENIPIEIEVLKNDENLDECDFETIFVSIRREPHANNPRAKSVTVNSENKVVYVPGNFALGCDSFVYMVQDTDFDFSEATVYVHVSPVSNLIPIANDDYVRCQVDSMQMFDVRMNDENLGDGGIHYQIVDSVSKGTVTIIDSINGIMQYVAPSGFVGETSFTYRVADIDNDCDTATVYITVKEGVNHVPQPSDDSYTVPMRTAKEWPGTVLNVLKNDTRGLEDGFKKLELMTQPAHGTVEVNTNNTLTYTPNMWFYGIDTFRYAVYDLDNEYGVALVTVNVQRKSNQKPVAVDDYRGCSFKGNRKIDVLRNDRGLTDVPITLKLIGASGPKHGTVSIVDPDTVLYTHTDEFVGIDSFQYLVIDRDNDCDTAFVFITVKADTNYVPIANDDYDTTFINTPYVNTSVTITILDNDENLYDGFKSISIVGKQPLGDVVINANHTVTYVPSYFYVGNDTFYYDLEDSQGDVDRAMVVVTVKDKPDLKPVANDDNVGCSRNKPVTIDVLFNDELGDLPPTVKLLDEPSSGKVVLDSITNLVTFTPDSAFAGVATFNYQLIDADGDKDEATVTVNVKYGKNYVPYANDDNAQTKFNTPVDIDVLQNDGGFEDGFSHIAVVERAKPKFGTVKVVKKPVSDYPIFSYTPSNWFVGFDTFMYAAYDKDGDYDEAMVVIDVYDVRNSVPKAFDDRRGCSKAGSRIIDVLVNDQGLDDVPIRIARVGENPASGSATALADNTFKFVVSMNPDSVAVFNYEVIDADNERDTASVTITIIDNNHIPIAVNDTLELPMKSTKIVDVLANDKGLDDGVDFYGVKIWRAPILSRAVVNADNTITIEASKWFTGADSLVYMVEDREGDYDTATLYINILEAIDHHPVANPDRRGMTLNTSIVLEVLENDTGLEDGNISLDITKLPKVGRCFVKTDLSVVYTHVGEVAPDKVTFEYTIRDIDNDSSTTTVTIMVRDPNHVPLAVDDTFNVYRNSESIIDVLYNDSGLDDGVEGVEIMVEPKHGSVAIEENVRVFYQSDSAYTGADTAVYRVYDIDGDFDDAYIFLTIDTIENLKPLAVEDTISTYANEDVYVEILLNDQVGNGLKVLRLTTEAEHGTAVLNEYNVMHYIPEADYTGVDKVNYILCDIDNECDSTTVTISIDWNPNLAVFIPEAFSPNGDGRNDVFKIQNVERFEKLTLYVYNRWGNKVYSSDDYQNDWDGRSNNSMSLGKKLPSGTYYYLVTIVDTGEKFKGSVYIKR